MKFILFYHLNWYADEAEQHVGKRKTGEEYVGRSLHLAVAEDGDDDEKVADDPQEKGQAAEKE